MKIRKIKITLLTFWGIVLFASVSAYLAAGYTFTEVAAALLKKYFIKSAPQQAGIH